MTNLNNAAIDRRVKCGVKMDLDKLPPDGPLHYFGIDEINAQLQQGFRIVSVDPPSAIMQKIGQDAENVRLTIVGFGMMVNFG